VDAQTAARVGEALNTPLLKREHPGHRLRARFLCGDMNATTTVTLELANVGDVPLIFQDGGMNRGMRNNQFGFTGFRDLKPLADIGSPVHFGGLSQTVVLRKGETFTKPVDLSKWFDLSEPGQYQFVGTFYLQIEPPAGGYRIVWDEYVGAAFQFTKARTQP
jgi:hypothetical protein